MKNKTIQKLLIDLDILTTFIDVNQINIQYEEETIFGKETKTIGFINGNIKNSFEQIEKKLLKLEAFNYELDFIRSNIETKSITIYYKEKRH